MLRSFESAESHSLKIFGPVWEKLSLVIIVILFDVSNVGRIIVSNSLVEAFQNKFISLCLHYSMRQSPTASTSEGA